MIQVRITSDKTGEGKTTVALMLMDLLKVHGFSVELEDDSRGEYFEKTRDPRVIASVKNQTNVKISTIATQRASFTAKESNANTNPG